VLYLLWKNQVFIKNGYWEFVTLIFILSCMHNSYAEFVNDMSFTKKNIYWWIFGGHFFVSKFAYLYFDS